MVPKDSFNKEAEALQKGDSASAGKIFDHFSKPIYAFFMARVRHKEVAQDLTQEVFLKVVKSIEQFNRGTGNFTAWIWQIARNSAIDYFRLKKPSYLADLPEEGGNIAEDKASSDGTAKIREIMEIVEKFSQEEQELFEHHFVADMSYADLAKVTGKSESSLRVAIHRLRKRLIPYLK
ncbi:MAG: sigma-70 family RNA polymerase sigma factor [Candidatus Pacebacteria bacterium]|nr:sigma-70 family RNA polymerase sigma factor [Candidatus Paceibacterota bacterium]